MVDKFQHDMKEQKKFVFLLTSKKYIVNIIDGDNDSSNENIYSK